MENITIFFENIENIKKYRKYPIFLYVSGIFDILIYLTSIINGICCYSPFITFILIYV